MTEEIRILLADDHDVVRRGLTALLDGTEGFTVVGAAADGEEAVALAGQQQPDVVLMDLSMPNVDGIEATRRLVAERPETRVVVLTSFSDRDRILDALDAGAVGYLLKDAEPAHLVRGIRAPARGAPAGGPSGPPPEPCRRWRRAPPPPACRRGPSSARPCRR